MPWAAWIAIYLAFDLGLAWLGLRREVGEVLSSFNPFFGTRLHLWYMPFVFLGMLSVRLVAPACTRIGSWGLVALSIVFAVLSGFVLPGVLDVRLLPNPIPQFLHGTPALFYGIALAQISRQEKTSVRNYGILAIAAAAVAIAVTRESLT